MRVIGVLEALVREAELLLQVGVRGLGRVDHRASAFLGLVRPDLLRRRVVLRGLEIRSVVEAPDEQPDGASAGSVSPEMRRRYVDRRSS